MPEVNPGASGSGSSRAGAAGPSHMLVLTLPDGEGQAFMIVLISPVIGVRRLGPAAHHDGLRGHSRGAQKRVQIFRVIEPAVEVKMIDVFLGRDFPDIRI